MSSEDLDIDELVTEAVYYTYQEEERRPLSRIHQVLGQVMNVNGYQPLNPEKVQIGSRTVEYVKNFDSDITSKTIGDRISTRLGLKSASDIVQEAYFEKLKSSRNDVPFIVGFRFIPQSFEAGEGYRIEVSTEPAVLLKQQQLAGVEKFDAKIVVRNCKELLKNVRTDLGWGTLYEPHTTAESLSNTLDRELRNRIKGTKYGSEVIQFVDEGDQCLSYGLLHSSLSSYIHAIEWSIICHLEEIEEKDLIEIENDSKRGLYYGDLVQRLEQLGEASQKTVEDLKRYKTDRRWMGHHKSGDLAEGNVLAVKDRLDIMLNEMFRASSED